MALVGYSLDCPEQGLPPALKCGRAHLLVRKSKLIRDLTALLVTVLVLVLV